MYLPKPLDDARKTLVNSRWAIGLLSNYQEGDILTLRFSPSKITWFAPHEHFDFFADCFITNYFKEPIIFFEYWKSNEGLGNISYVSIADVKEHADNIEPYIHTALSGATHFSYPYTFEFEEKLYMIPENYQSGELAIYQARDRNSPDVWKKVSVVFPQYQGIDPNIFYHNGYWWLFVTPYSLLHRDAEKKLEIYYTENPIHGEWKHHALSPVFYKKSIARNGGRPFVYNGKLYRPTQNCRKTYGGELCLMQIDELTPDKFSEHEVVTLSGYAPYEKAFHTFSTEGNIAVIDGNAAECSLEMPLHFIKYVRNIFRKK